MTNISFMLYDDVSEFQTEFKTDATTDTLYNSKIDDFQIWISIFSTVFDIIVACDTAVVKCHGYEVDEMEPDDITELLDSKDIRAESNQLFDIAMDTIRNSGGLDVDQDVVEDDLTSQFE